MDNFLLKEEKFIFICLREKKKHHEGMTFHLTFT